MICGVYMRLSWCAGMLEQMDGQTGGHTKQTHGQRQRGWKGGGDAGIVRASKRGDMRGRENERERDRHTNRQ